MNQRTVRARFFRNESEVIIHIFNSNEDQTSLKLSYGEFDALIDAMKTYRNTNAESATFVLVGQE